MQVWSIKQTTAGWQWGFWQLIVQWRGHSPLEVQEGKIFLLKQAWRTKHDYRITSRNQISSAQKRKGFKWNFECSDGQKKNQQCMGIDPQKQNRTHTTEQNEEIHHRTEKWHLVPQKEWGYIPQNRMWIQTTEQNEDLDYRKNEDIHHRAEWGHRTEQGHTT